MRTQIEEVQNTDGGFMNRFSWWHRSYIGDYLMFVVLAICLIIVYFGISASTAFMDVLKYMSDTERKMYNFPLTEPEYLPIADAAAIVILVPSFFFVFFSITTKSLHELHDSFLGFLTGGQLMLISSEFYKRTFGMLRPDFLARCLPNDQFVCSTLGSSSLEDGLQTFPSGHASAAMYAFTFLALYLYGKLKPYDTKWQVYPVGPLFRVCLILAPLFLGIWICCTRVTQYRHFLRDISVGGGLGIFLAVVSYHMCFHFFHSPLSHLPRSRVNPDYVPLLEVRDNPSYGSASENH